MESSRNQRPSRGGGGVIVNPVTQHLKEEALTKEMDHQEPANGVPQEGDESWHLKLLEAHSRYQTATTEYRRILSGHPNGLAPGLDSSLSHARETESQALAEYMRVLAIFTDLTTHGKGNGEPSAGGSGLL